MSARPISAPEGLDALVAEMTAIRRDIHKHPEVAYEEFRTADIVSAKLSEWGIEHERGIAETGIVATIRNGSGNRAIGLRADMDALHVQEFNTFEHASVHEGKMHACGHDGHTAMLLGAAKVLARDKPFDGTVHLMFQPAEEGLGGARKMVEEGLFRRFPCDAVYGLHNGSNVEAGSFLMRTGPILAASDTWDVTFTGRGTHGAMPHRGTDATAAAAQFVIALQSICARVKDPMAPAVISTGAIHGGDPAAPSVVPEVVRVTGTARSFTPEVRDLLEDGIRRAADSAAALYGVAAVSDYLRRYPPTVNAADCVDVAYRAAVNVAGEAAVDRNCDAMAGAEDFSFMAQEVPGAYVFIGNGPGENGCELHAPTYDFNDEIIAPGVRYWLNLVETELPHS